MTPRKPQAANKNTNTEFTTKRIQDLTEPLVGVFRGSRTIETKFGTNNVHKIGDEELYGTALLDKSLEDIAPGTTVSVTFNGKEPTAKGGFRYLAHVQKIQDK